LHKLQSSKKCAPRKQPSACLSQYAAQEGAGQPFALHSYVLSVVTNIALLLSHNVHHPTADHSHRKTIKHTRKMALPGISCTYGRTEGCCQLRMALCICCRCI
jgi:hypothetical protein